MTDSVQSAPALEWSDLAEVFERRHGLRADEAARARLKSAQAERMRSLRIGQADAYRALLERQPDEVQRLLDLFLVGETSFFRTPAYFEALRQQVLPELDRRLPAGARLRVWSAGCSSGEEAYSLAMVCAEQLNGRRPFEVIATDLSVASLERAARGRYGQRSVARLPAYLSERYVERHDSEFVVAASIRERVQWTRLNLVEQPLRVDLRASVHVIFCQNVLIYFTEEALGRALGNLGAALAEGGYLFLGYSERLPTPWPGFDYVWLAGAGAWRKSGSSGQEAGDRRQEAGDRRQEAGGRT